MGRSGSGFVRCSDGRVRWGLFGAAGVVLRHRDDDGTWHVLLQLRSAHSHEGGTWGIPGGALDEHESPAAGALREAIEELGDLPPHRIEPEHHVWRPALRSDQGADPLERLVPIHGNGTVEWAYTTIVATVDARFEPTLNWETEQVRWAACDEVTNLRLHPGFAASWPHVRPLVLAEPTDDD